MDSAIPWGSDMPGGARTSPQAPSSVLGTARQEKAHGVNGAACPPACARGQVGAGHQLPSSKPKTVPQKISSGLAAGQPVKNGFSSFLLIRQIFSQCRLGPRCCCWPELPAALEPCPERQHGPEDTTGPFAKRKDPSSGQRHRVHMDRKDGGSPGARERLLTLTHTHARVHTLTHTCTRTCSHARTHTNTLTRMHTQTHVHMLTCACTHTCSRSHARTHTNKHTQVHTHVHMLTHMHTHVLTRSHAH